MTYNHWKYPFGLAGISSIFNATSTSRQHRVNVTSTPRQRQDTSRTAHRNFRLADFGANLQTLHRRSKRIVKSSREKTARPQIKNFILDWRESRRSSSSLLTIGPDRQKPHEKDIASTDHLRLQRPFDAETENFGDLTSKKNI